MGKARILSGGSDGLYTVERVYDRTFYAQEKADLEAEIANIDARLAQANDQLDAIEAQATEADQALKEAQDLYVEAVRNRNENPDAEWIDPSTGETVDDPSVFYMDQLERTMESVAEVYTARGGLKNDIALMEAAKLSAEKRIEKMDAVADPAPESAWCADFTEDASGEVATIEIPGEPQKLLVAPQHASGAGEPIGGTLMPREWMTGPQAFFNAAILPGWQRWKPTYRVGVIQGVDRDNNTCAVRIDGAFSTAQDLDVNSLDHVTLADVPVQYMECGAYAFDPGDRVVVLFGARNWSSPVVVGFSNGPKECPTTSHYEVMFTLPADFAWYDGSSFPTCGDEMSDFSCYAEDGSLDSFQAYPASGHMGEGHQNVLARIAEAEVNEWKANGGYNYGDDEFEWDGLEVGAEYETPWKGPRYGSHPDYPVYGVSSPEASGMADHIGRDQGRWRIEARPFSRAFSQAWVPSEYTGATTGQCADKPEYYTLTARAQVSEMTDVAVIDDPNEALNLLLSWGLPASLTATHKETGKTFQAPISKAVFSRWNMRGGELWVTYTAGGDADPRDE